MNPIDHLRVALAEAGFRFVAPVSHKDKDAPWLAWKFALELSDNAREAFFVVVPQGDNAHMVNVSIRGGINGNWSDFRITVYIEDCMLQMQQIAKELVAAWKAAQNVAKDCLDD